MLQNKVMSATWKHSYEKTVRNTADKYLDLLVGINPALTVLSLDEIAQIFELKISEAETLKMLIDFVNNPKVAPKKINKVKIEIATRKDFWEKIKAHINRLADGPKRKIKEPRLPRIDETRVVNHYFLDEMILGDNRNVVIGKLQNDVIYKVGILKIDNQDHYNDAKVYFTKKALLKFGHYKRSDLQKQLNALLKYGFQSKYDKETQGLVEIKEGDKLHPSRGGRWHYKVHTPGSVQLVGNIDTNMRFETVFVIDDLVPQP
jgi:hypothetical protein